MGTRVGWVDCRVWAVSRNRSVDQNCLSANWVCELSAAAVQLGEKLDLFWKSIDSFCVEYCGGVMDDWGEAEVARPSSNDSIRSLKFSEKEREWGLKWFVIISAGLTSQPAVNEWTSSDWPAFSLVLSTAQTTFRRIWWLSTSTSSPGWSQTFITISSQLNLLYCLVLRIVNLNNEVSLVRCLHSKPGCSHLGWPAVSTRYPPLQRISDTPVTGAETQECGAGTRDNLGWSVSWLVGYLFVCAVVGSCSFLGQNSWVL